MKVYMHLIWWIKGVCYCEARSPDIYSAKYEIQGLVPLHPTELAKTLLNCSIKNSTKSPKCYPWAIWSTLVHAGFSQVGSFIVAMKVCSIGAEPSTSKAPWFFKQITKILILNQNRWFCRWSLPQNIWYPENWNVSWSPLLVRCLTGQYHYWNSQIISYLRYLPDPGSP